MNISLNMTWDTFVIQEFLPWAHCAGSSQCHGTSWNCWGCPHTCDCHQGWEGPEGDQRGVLQEKQCSPWACSGQGNFWRLQEVPPLFDGERRVTYFHFKDTCNWFLPSLWLKLLSKFVSLNDSLNTLSSRCYLCRMRELEDIN